MYQQNKRTQNHQMKRTQTNKKITITNWIENLILQDKIIYKLERNIHKQNGNWKIING